MDSRFTRRTLFLALPTVTMVGRVIAQAAAPLRARALNHLALAVSDLK